VYSSCFCQADRRALAETICLMLKAGSSTTGPEDCAPLQVLLPVTILNKSDYCESFLKQMCLCEESLPLRAEVLGLLLKHGARPTPVKECFTYNMVILKLAAKLAIAVDSPQRLDVLSLTSDRCHELINILGDMLRCLLLAASGTKYSAIYKEVFISSFASIIVYSSKPGRSDRLLRLVLYALNASQVNELKTELSTLLKSTQDATDMSEETSQFNKVLEYLRGVETPLCLQDLARRTINSAMSSRRCLDGYSSLGLSKNQAKYVQLLQGLNRLNI